MNGSSSVKKYPSHTQNMMNNNNNKKAENIPSFNINTLFDAVVNFESMINFQSICVRWLCVCVFPFSLSLYTISQCDFFVSMALGPETDSFLSTKMFDLTSFFFLLKYIDLSGCEQRFLPSSSFS